jgi:hypothetical protein
VPVADLDDCVAIGLVIGGRRLHVGAQAAFSSEAL